MVSLCFVIRTHADMVTSSHRDNVMTSTSQYSAPEMSWRMRLMWDLIDRIRQQFRHMFGADVC